MILNYQFEHSTMLSSCSYDTESNELIVIFTNGKPYTYIDVDKAIWNELIVAKSAGQYFNSIKKNLKQKS